MVGERSVTEVGAAGGGFLAVPARDLLVVGRAWM